MHTAGDIDDREPEECGIGSAEDRDVIGDRARLISHVTMVSLVHQLIDAVPARERTGGNLLHNTDKIGRNHWPPSHRRFSVTP
ncbi:hypothetical protein GCM10007269_14980 [Microbacterium murale]|uniref:Uncharacterized protein n=1 Tax=Microbacterium murale TaxID=1081040 RepID=A0ABQ1RMX4_9MICO|nr:hypothetical protein GCM10007269_14980 [Microbacterium murale]